MIQHEYHVRIQVMEESTTRTRLGRSVRVEEMIYWHILTFEGYLSLVNYTVRPYSIVVIISHSYCASAS